jgi:hypothetical protein
MKYLTCYFLAFLSLFIITTNVSRASSFPKRLSNNFYVENTNAPVYYNVKDYGAKADGQTK